LPHCRSRASTSVAGRASAQERDITDDCNRDRGGEHDVRETRMPRPYRGHSGKTRKVAGAPPSGRRTGQLSRPTRQGRGRLERCVVPLEVSESARLFERTARHLAERTVAPAPAITVARDRSRKGRDRSC
jgi:hypothetical protein